MSLGDEFADELMQAAASSAIAQAQENSSAAICGLRCPTHRMPASIRVSGRSLNHLSLSIKGCCDPFMQRIKQYLESNDRNPNNLFPEQASITNGTMNLQDFSSRRRFVERQDFQDATPRIISFVRWVDADEEGHKILGELRGIDVKKLLDGCGLDSPPQPSTPTEGAAIALDLIESAATKGGELFQYAMTIGVRSTSRYFQDTHNELERRYLSPFYDYLEEKLFGVSGPAEVRPVAKNTRDVFIVHGRDEEVKETVARFLEKLGLHPIILHEQPNKGRTVIEKFEECAEVSFAVVLLTPDDEGGLKGGEMRARARQNVILELGYFLGRLGRGHVAAIFKGESMDIPSDYQGVLFTAYDSRGGWKLELVRELKAAGFPVDANQAF